MPADVRERCLAVIPARGGSKRVPRKNLRAFAGKPMIAWSIEAARGSGRFARVVVSTDSEEIAAVSREYGAEVPFQRAAALADDHTPVSAATVDAVERLCAGGDDFDLVCQLMPNCPLRTAADVEASLAHMRSSGAEVQLSMSRFGWLNPWWAMRVDKRGELEAMFPSAMSQRSQDLPDLFCVVGAVWWAKTGTLVRTRTFHVQQRTGWEIPFPRGIDIDTEDDLRMALALHQSSSTVETSR